MISMFFFFFFICEIVFLLGMFFLDGCFSRFMSTEGRPMSVITKKWGVERLKGVGVLKSHQTAPSVHGQVGTRASTCEKVAIILIWRFLITLDYRHPCEHSLLYFWHPFDGTIVSNIAWYYNIIFRNAQFSVWGRRSQSHQQSGKNKPGILFLWLAQFIWSALWSRSSQLKRST